MSNARFWIVSILVGFSLFFLVRAVAGIAWGFFVAVAVVFGSVTVFLFLLAALRLWNKGSKRLIGAFVVIVLFIGGAFQATFDDRYSIGQATPRLPLKESQAIQINLHQRISGDSWFGCQTRDYLEKLTDYLIQEDTQAFREAFAVGLLVGKCTTFLDGEAVYIMDSAIFSGLVKVRRQGETQEYWLPTEAVR